MFRVNTSLTVIPRCTVVPSTTRCHSINFLRSSWPCIKDVGFGPVWQKKFCWPKGPFLSAPRGRMIQMEIWFLPWDFPFVQSKTRGPPKLNWFYSDPLSCVRTLTTFQRKLIIFAAKRILLGNPSMIPRGETMSAVLRSESVNKSV